MNKKITTLIELAEQEKESAIKQIKLLGFCMDNLISLEPSYIEEVVKEMEKIINKYKY